MDDATDEQTVKAFDQAWNHVYLRNDRAAFAEILAGDCCAVLSEDRTAGKVDMMKPTPQGAKVSFSEGDFQIFPPPAVTIGRVRIKRADRVVDQRYVRVYSKRARGWQAVTVFVFPLGGHA